MPLLQKEILLVGGPGHHPGGDHTHPAAAYPANGGRIHRTITPSKPW